eukprot:CAMPEP_0194567260 /NCGR_PEP_ID=MMETSP0292-20121207/5799_1 /TAXON_ID=39354 /ORGANISM="Heterosigma akashiwo, Strain CCMP2393" /LENGTH=212 /DNA_ID=CAMNT_0039416979 /DNA_START=192 /DNA_END=827 /DNA_ORIENTATION=+
MFGIPLDQACCESVTGIPTPIYDACAWLAGNNHLSHPGLFLLSTKRRDSLAKLLQAYQSKPSQSSNDGDLTLDIVLNMLPEHERPHVATSLIVLYLAYLPEPLLSGNTKEAFLDAAYVMSLEKSSNNDTEKASKNAASMGEDLIKAIASQLPRHLYFTLGALLNLWHKVAAAADAEASRPRGRAAAAAGAVGKGEGEGGGGAAIARAPARAL